MQQRSVLRWRVTRRADDSADLGAADRGVRSIRDFQVIRSTPVVQLMLSSLVSSAAHLKLLADLGK